MSLHSSAHWRKMADETRARAVHMSSDELRGVMLWIAEQYDALARQTAELEDGEW